MELKILENMLKRLVKLIDAACGEVGRSPIEKDREAARLLIMQEKDIPQDLSERLLEYKKRTSGTKVSKTKASHSVK